METTVHFNLYAGNAHPFCSATGILLGPAGQVWDLYPRLGYGPRLLAYGAEGILVASDAESALSPAHPATPPWMSGLEGLEARATICLSHDGRYLGLTMAERDDQGRLRVSHRRPEYAKRERLTLAGVNGLLRLHGDSARMEAVLDEDRWCQNLVGGSYLLLHPNATAAQGLLDFANGFDLPGAPESRRWAAPIALGRRSRLSPLASRRAA